MSARDEIRKYVRLLADWWTPPSKTDERVEHVYAAVRAEVLRESGARLATMQLPEHLKGTLNAGSYKDAWLDCRKVIKEMAEDKPGAAADCACGPQLRCKNGHCSRHYLCEDCGNCCSCECGTGGEKATASAATATPQPAPADLRAEDSADLTTLAPAESTAVEISGDTIHLDMAATREQWAAWQKALAVDLARTTGRGRTVTSHATWRGVHVAIRCYLVEPAPVPAEVPAPVTGWHAARELTGRLARLLTAITDQRGEWTTNRVLRLYRTTREDVARSAVREDLHALHGLGWLVQHDEKGRRFYTLNTRKDDGR